MTKKRTHNIHCVYTPGSFYHSNATYVQKYPLNVGDVINFTFEGFQDNTPITVLVKERGAYDPWETGNACISCPLSHTDSTNGCIHCRAVRSLKRSWNTRTICRKGSSWAKSFSFVNPDKLLEEL